MLRWRVLLSMALLALLLCVGCSTPMTHRRRCPQPSVVEIDDYEAVVFADPDRPVVRWVGRLVSFCWPEESNDSRR